MQYQTFEPHPDLSSIVQCYWSLEVPARPNPEKQRIVPDGTIEMAFILGDDIRRFTSDSDFIIQPRAMILGQTIKPFYIQPVGEVKTFAVRFYPYGFANFIETDIKDLLNKETHINLLFEKEEARELSIGIGQASNTEERIAVVENFLLERMSQSTTIDKIVTSTVDDIIQSNGSLAVHELVKMHQSNRRQLERKFSKQVGLSPKQLGKVIRLQAALKLLIHDKGNNLTQVAYASDYYDQAHFIKDFREFTGTSPKDYLKNKNLELSTLFYSPD